jgi:hypothetical protein
VEFNTLNELDHCNTSYSGAEISVCISIDEDHFQGCMVEFSSLSPTETVDR